MNDLLHIIFDNDGVNIDSEDVAMRVMDDWGSALVFRFRPAANLQKDYIYRKWPGTSTDRIVDAVINEFELPRDQIVLAYNLPLNDNLGIALADLITLETNERFKRDLKAIPGATQTLMEIREMFGAENIALATTSRADRMDISLAYAKDPVTGANARLEEMFPVGPRRRSGYGHSNKYDEAFAALGWDPNHTAIVEDSISGVTKGKSSRPGVRVIGTVAAMFYGNKPEQASALVANGADIVISHYTDLASAVRWLKAGMPVGVRPGFNGQVYVPSRGQQSRTGQLSSTAALVP